MFSFLNKSLLISFVFLTTSICAHNFGPYQESGLYLRGGGPRLGSEKSSSKRFTFGGALGCNFKLHNRYDSYVELHYSKNPHVFDDLLSFQESGLTLSLGFKF